MHVESEYRNLCWPFGQHQLTGMEIIRRHRNLYPIYITNHGCGPDTALQHYMEKAMEGREHLHLEVDEHSSKVGITTRLEAFLYSLKQSNTGSASKAAPKERISAPDTVLLPDFGIYTRLLEREVPEGLAVQRVTPLTRHHSFNYAMNKEYYSLLVTLEELLNTAEEGKPYDLLSPRTRGAKCSPSMAV